MSQATWMSITRVVPIHSLYYLFRYLWTQIIPKETFSSQKGRTNGILGDKYMLQWVNAKGFYLLSVFYSTSNLLLLSLKFTLQSFGPSDIIVGTMELVVFVLMMFYFLSVNIILNSWTVTKNFKLKIVFNYISTTGHDTNLFTYMVLN